MDTERFIRSLHEAGKDENVPEYLQALEDVSTAAYYQRYPPKNYWEVIPSRHSNPNRVAERLDPKKAITQAAMWTSAIQERGNNNSIQGSVDGGIKVLLSGIWKGTNLEPLAHICEETLDQLQPTLSNPITVIDVEKMKHIRSEKLTYGKPKEVLVFLGLNGVGKDYMIGLLEKFLKFCKIPIEIIKMPNPNGPLFGTIDKFLHGDSNVQLNSNAAQLLFLADAANTEVSSGKLTIMNRDPRFDALVFGQETLHPTILSSHPIFDNVTHTLVIDRLPATAMKQRAQRNTTPRIFEKSVEAMLYQHLKYAALTYLPGVRFLNTDFLSRNNKEQLNYSLNRLYYFVKAFGIIQRTMVNTKIANDYAHAGVILEEKFGEFKTENKYWLDS